MVDRFSALAKHSGPLLHANAKDRSPLFAEIFRLTSDWKRTLLVDCLRSEKDRLDELKALLAQDYPGCPQDLILKTTARV